MFNDHDALNSLIRSDFYSYVQKTFSEATGGEKFIPSWHLELICDTLEKCRRGEIKRLIINVPPRSLKSIIVNVGFTSWLLAHNPSEKIVSVSYSAELSEKFARDTKNIMKSNWYQKAFPSTVISKDRHSAYDFNTTKKGSRFSTSVEGTLTGRGGNWIIIDDPIKPGDIMSDNNLNKVNQWYRNTLLSRLNNKETGVIIVIMQRVHENDLSGYLLSNEEGWHHLRIPAIAEEDELWHLSDGRKFIRNEGSVICPAQLTKNLLATYKTQMGSFVFSGQYQQNPAPLDGGLIKKKWFKYYSTNELPDQFKFIIHSWDTASKTEEINAYSVCTTWGVNDNNDYYLLGVFRDRLEMPDLVKKAVYIYEKYLNKACLSKMLIEDQSSGIQLLQWLFQDYPQIITQAIKPEGDKIARFRGASVKIEKGEVYFPETKQGWWPEFENELMRFPNSRYKDQVDSLSQALNQPLDISILDVLY